MKKIIISGSRSIKNKTFIFEKINSYFGELTDEQKEKIEIVSGDDIGPECFGKEWAEEQGINVKLFVCDWDKHGKSARYKKHIEMVDYATNLIVFYDNTSIGTNHLINLSLEKSLRVKIYKVSKENLYEK